MKKVFYILALILCASGEMQAKMSCAAGFIFQVNGLTVSFTDGSTSSNTINSWQWDFGDGNVSTSQNPSHTYALADTFNVCLTIHDNHGCSSTFCHPVIAVSAHNCNADFTFHSNGLTVSFTDGSTSSNTISSWQWDFGDGSTSTSQDPSHTYTIADTFNVCLTIQDNHGCSSTYCHHVIVATVHPCHASFTFGVDSTGMIVHFTNTSSGTTGATTYSWDFGDGNISTLENPVQTYTHGGHHVVCLFISDSTTGCSSHFCHVIFHGHVHHHHAALSTAKVMAPIESTKENSFLVYPNPVTSNATIEYVLSKDASVKIQVYDLIGNLVTDKYEFETEGLYSHEMDFTNLSNGFYLIKLSVNNETFTKKITIQNK